MYNDSIGSICINIFCTICAGRLCDEPPWFGRTVIRSCAKLDYSTAQRMIDGLIPSAEKSDEKIDEHLWESNRQPLLESGHTTTQCIQDVLYMNIIAQNRRKKRISSGSLIINKLKLTFSLDKDGNPIDMSSYHIQQSNNLVEEMMLIANYLSAKYLLFNVYGAAFLRYMYMLLCCT